MRPSPEPWLRWLPDRLPRATRPATTAPSRSTPSRSRTTPPTTSPTSLCKFDIDFYNYADDAVAQILLEGQAPSGSGTIYTKTLNLQKDPAGGGTDWDGEQLVRINRLDLAGLTAHPIQGYHVKLTVNVTSSIGADVKHKVFWMQPCEYDGGSGY